MKQIAIAALAVVFLAGGAPAFAQEASGAMSNSMSKDAMSKDTMKKDSMKKDSMKKDTMKKSNDAMGMKKEASGAMAN
ncbi:MAG TPA: pentapeptide MXKDX repeat protein [Paraburkholderia sp.]|nr:pentapeptide MXKDX repeat protein [Paraburkholderia sp.]